MGTLPRCPANSLTDEFGTVQVFYGRGGVQDARRYPACPHAGTVDQ